MWRLARYAWFNLSMYTHILRFDQPLDKTSDLENLTLTPSLDNRVAQIVNGTSSLSQCSCSLIQKVQVSMAEAFVRTLSFTLQIQLPFLVWQMLWHEHSASNNFVQTFGVSPNDAHIANAHHAQQLFSTWSFCPRDSGGGWLHDPPYFSRLYKKHMGVTPRTFMMEAGGNVPIK